MVIALVIGVVQLDAGAALLLTAAGGGTDDGRSALFAQLATPKDAIFDSAGNLYIADSGHHRVRKVDAITKTITTVAGNGLSVFAGDGGPATAAAVAGPEALAFDAQGNLYISEGNRIRKVDAATQIITTIAGNGGGGSIGDGGPALAAEIISAEGLALDGAGNLYIADAPNNRIRKVTAATGIITTVAGTGTFGFAGDGGPATGASLRSPSDVVVDASGNLLIADSFNHRIRRVDAATQIISTIAGSQSGFAGDGGPAAAARLTQPNGVFLDPAGNLYIADTNNLRIRRVDAATQIITTVAGVGSFGLTGDGGPALAAGMVRPENVAVDAAGNVYITDTVGRIRRVDVATNIITTAAGGGDPVDGVQATAAVLIYPQSVAFDAAGNLYIAEGSRIRRVDAVTRVITTIAGNGSSAFSGDGGPALAASLTFPSDVAVDAAGNVYVADRSRIRKISVGTNIITTVAGTGNAGFSGDGGPAVAANLGSVFRLAVDAAGNLFIADTVNHRIRMVNAASQQITTVAGNGGTSFSGDGGPATSAALVTATEVAVDAAGNLFIVDEHRIRRVDAATRIITTIAGNGEPGLSGDGGLATAANLTSPSAVAVDAKGNVYISDRGSQYIRKVDGTTRIITRIAGNGISGFAGDAAPAASPLGNVVEIAIGPGGNPYFADSDNHRIRTLGEVRRRAVRR